MAAGLEAVLSVEAVVVAMFTNGHGEFHVKAQALYNSIRNLISCAI